MVKTTTIDLNCDMGESFGVFKLGNDPSVMPYITSANIACGLHAGDPSVMQTTVRLAKQHAVSIGAHPGWPDLQGFGRREMILAPDETESYVLYQIGALAAFARAEGVPVRHVKPHGALYNQAAQDRALADAIGRAIKRFDRDLILVGLAGSAMIASGLELGLQVASEGFPDRRYDPNGMLVSRRLANATIESAEEVALHAIDLATRGIDFGGKHVRVDTLCLHGDHVNAAQNAKRVHEALAAHGFSVQAPDPKTNTIG
jgi:5-oxoprolinase (ATP-hydrolysing) subunit A